MNEMTHLEDLADRIEPRQASNVLLWVVLGFVAVFVLWASLTELDRTVRGAGRVIASSQLQVISNPEGGVVEAILVKTGQEVKQGEELVRLDRTPTTSDFGSGEASVNALMAKIARLQAEVRGREPVYPAASDPASASQIAIERSLHASRMAELSSMTNAGQAAVAQAREAVREAEAMHRARTAARDAREQELSMIRPLVERGIEPRLSLIQAESAHAVAAGEVAAAAASIARARSAVAEAQSGLARQRVDRRTGVTGAGQAHPRWHAGDGGGAHRVGQAHPRRHRGPRRGGAPAGGWSGRRTAPPDPRAAEREPKRRLETLRGRMTRRLRG